MFKHSVIKRDGEEDVTIWINHSFEEVPSVAESPHKRAVEVIDDRWLRLGLGHQERCNWHTFRGNTGPTAPCTGGIKQIRDWVRLVILPILKPKSNFAC